MAEDTIKKYSKKILNRVSFSIRTDDDYRPCRVHDNIMHHAAEKEVMKAALCCRSHPDKGYVLLMCNPWNLSLGFPCHYDSPGFDAERCKLVADFFDPDFCSFHCRIMLSFAFFNNMQENDLSCTLYGTGESGCFDGEL